MESKIDVASILENSHLCLTVDNMHTNIIDANMAWNVSSLKNAKNMMKSLQFI